MIDNEVVRELRSIAARLDVSYGDLFRLIDFESGFNPAASNPRSSARGLLQFIDASAQEMGYIDSRELVEENPTIKDQLPLVEKYLNKFFPFNDRKDLFMSVFYPAYRRLPANTVFPAAVQSVNPGIVTIQDYIDLVDGKKKIMS